MSRAFRETVGGLPAAFWWLWTGTLVNRIGSFVWPFLAFYLTSELHKSAFYTGMVLSLFGGGQALAAVVGGVLADRLGRRPTMLLANVTTAVSLVGLGLVRGSVLIAVVTTVTGFFMNLSRPAYTAMMTDVVPAPDRLRAFSLNYWAINLGFAIAPVLAGVLAGHGYMLLFALNAVATMLTALLIFAFVAESRPDAAESSHHEANTGERAPGLGAVFRDSTFMTFLLLTFFLQIVFTQCNIALPIVMTNDGISTSGYGAAIAVNGVVIVLLTLPVARVIDRYRRSRVLALAALIIGIGFGLTGFAHTVPMYAATIAVWTIGEILTAPTATAVVSDLAPASLRGRYQGMFAFAWSAASFVGPMLGGYVMGHLGVNVLWASCFVVGAVVALAHLAVAPARARRLAELKAAVPELEPAAL
jgi:MFS family permease